MYSKWSRGVGVNGDKGAYISFTADENSETWQLAYAMPIDVIFQSVYALTGEGYVIQFRTNEYHNKLETSIFRRAQRWQDQQYLQCLTDDAVMGLACLLVRFYEDFYAATDWRFAAIEKEVQRVSQKIDKLDSELPNLDEIPF